ncbi:MAG: arginyltransferase [bacterium]|nr:arginyltransferase [bacterium]
MHHAADSTLITRAPQLSTSLQQQFGCASSMCPYGLDQQAVYHQASFTRMANKTMGDLLANGYRRNGNHMYTMHCPDCALCVSIRLDPLTFAPNRNQRRIWRKNKDIVVQQAPLAMSHRSLGLLDKFLRIRFNNARNQAQSYYSHFFITTISTCFELRYWAGSDLIGIAIVDAAPNCWLNAVYFYFDPDQSRRSPGTLNILNLVSFCRKHRIPHLYLGYWIDGLSEMAYKKAFKPHELLLDGTWRLCT